MDETLKMLSKWIAKNAYFVFVLMPVMFFYVDFVNEDLLIKQNHRGIPYPRISVDTKQVQISYWSVKINPQYLLIYNKKEIVPCHNKSYEDSLKNNSSQMCELSAPNPINTMIFVILEILATTYGIIRLIKIINLQNIIERLPITSDLWYLLRLINYKNRLFIDNWLTTYSYLFRTGFFSREQLIRSLSNYLFFQQNILTIQDIQESVPNDNTMPHLNFVNQSKLNMFYHNLTEFFLFIFICKKIPFITKKEMEILATRLTTQHNINYNFIKNKPTEKDIITVKKFIDHCCGIYSSDLMEYNYLSKNEITWDKFMLIIINEDVFQNFPNLLNLNKFNKYGFYDPINMIVNLYVGILNSMWGILENDQSIPQELREFELKIHHKEANRLISFLKDQSSIAVFIKNSIKNDILLPIEQDDIFGINKKENDDDDKKGNNQDITLNVNLNTKQNDKKQMLLTNRETISKINNTKTKQTETKQNNQQKYKVNFLLYKHLQIKSEGLFLHFIKNYAFWVVWFLCSCRLYYGFYLLISLPFLWFAKKPIDWLFSFVKTLCGKIKKFFSNTLKRLSKK